MMVEVVVMIMMMLVMVVVMVVMIFERAGQVKTLPLLLKG